MPSTYTVNLGIEKPATGEQSGTWGDSANTNYDLIDEAINGSVAVTLAATGSSGSPNALIITNGASSNGRNKFIEFVDSSDLGGSAYVQLQPSDAEKLAFVRNSLSGGRSIFLFQGPYDASRDIEIPNGVDMLVKFSGGSATATVTDVFTKLRVTELTTPTLTATTADIDGGTIDGVTISGGTVDGATIGGTSAGAGTFSSLTATTADINGGTVDGVTIGGTSAGAGTFSSLTATTADINGGTVDGATIGGASAGAGTFTTLTANTNITVNATVTIDGVLDEDNMASDSDTKLATQQSIKAYVDNSIPAPSTLSSVLSNGNTSGATDLVINNGQVLTTNTINETTAGSGVTVDSVLLKDDGVNATNVEVTNIKANDGTSSMSIANSTGKVTITSFSTSSADINGGTIDNAIIGNSVPTSATFTSLTASLGTITGDLAVDTDTLYVDASADSVGVGVTTPQDLLHLKAASPAIRIENTTGGEYSTIEVDSGGNLVYHSDKGNTSSGDGHRWHISNSTKMVLNPQAGLALAYGNGDGYGITFDSSSYVVANTLNYYKRGIWTPVLSDSSTGGNTATTTSSSGSYMRIGLLVLCSIRITGINSSGMSALPLYLQDLPFAGGVIGNQMVPIGRISKVDVAAGSFNPHLEILENQTYARFAMCRDNNIPVSITPPNLSSGADIIATFTYFAYG